jgi:hypothetical protein
MTFYLVLMICGAIGCIAVGYLVGRLHGYDIGQADAEADAPAWAQVPREEPRGDVPLSGIVRPPVPDGLWDTVPVSGRHRAALTGPQRMPRFIPKAEGQTDTAWMRALTDEFIARIPEMAKGNGNA